MNRMTLEVRGNDGIVKAAGSDDGQAQLVYSGAYQPGYEANRKTFISSFSLTMPWGRLSSI